jgi:hypothetical protein
VELSYRPDGSGMGVKRSYRREWSRRGVIDGTGVRVELQTGVEWEGNDRREWSDSWKGCPFSATVHVTRSFLSATCYKPK